MKGCRRHVAAPRMVRIAADALEGVWPKIASEIAAAAARSGRFGEAHVKGWIEQGHMQLWLSVKREPEAVCVTELLDYPAMRVVSIVLATGKGMAAALGHLDALIEWGRAQGAERIEAWARPGWSRRLEGWRCTHLLLERDLEPLNRRTSHAPQ